MLTTARTLRFLKSYRYCKQLSYYKFGTSGISEQNGFWRTFSFGMLAMKKVRSFEMIFPINSKTVINDYLEYL